MPSVDVPEDIARVEASLLAEGAPFELVDVEVDGVTIRSFKNRIRTLRDLLLKSVEFGDNTYMLATDGVHERRLSYSEHARLVASVATALRDRFDVQPGDRVAILGATEDERVVLVEDEAPPDHRPGGHPQRHPRSHRPPRYERHDAM